MMKGRETLKRCPFCGGTAKVRHTVMVKYGYAITCEDCGADVFFYGKEFSRSDMVKAWNRRVENERND